MAGAEAGPKVGRSFGLPTRPGLPRQFVLVAAVQSPNGRDERQRHR